MKKTNSKYIHVVALSAGSHNMEERERQAAKYAGVEKSRGGERVPGTH